MTPPSLGDQVGQAASLLGLLLALDTLFTSEQARRVEGEETREGGPRHRVLRVIRATSIGLALLTAASCVFLGPLIGDVVAAIGDPQWQPVFGVFALTYVLLLALFLWQVSIASKTR